MQFATSLSTDRVQQSSSLRSCRPSPTECLSLSLSLSALVFTTFLYLVLVVRESVVYTVYPICNSIGSRSLQKRSTLFPFLNKVKFKDLIIITVLGKTI